MDSPKVHIKIYMKQNDIGQQQQYLFATAWLDTRRA